MPNCEFLSRTVEIQDPLLHKPCTRVSSPNSIKIYFPEMYKEVTKRNQMSKSQQVNECGLPINPETKDLILPTPVLNQMVNNI